MSWLARLFTSRKKQPSCLDIVSDYVAVVDETHSQLNGLISIDVLPYGKGQIKEAILEAALICKDDPRDIEVLGSVYVALADFQPNAPSPKKKLPTLEEGKAMSEAEFRAFMHEQDLPRQIDPSERKKALEEARQLLGEWEQHMTVLGVSNA